MKRRNFIKTTSLGAGVLSVGMPGAFWTFASKSSDPKEALIFDAMGEIRDVYSPALIGEILDSGMNAITVTLCDPKTFGQEAYEVGMDGILSYDRYLKSNPDLFIKATKVSDIVRAKKEGKLAVFYLFQTSTQFERDLDRVDVFYNLGVRSSQITYNYQNWAGAGCKERTGAGLTYFGVELVEKMNDVGMLIDLSHANQSTMEDTIETSKAPVIISHTGSMGVFENERNTSDEMMKLLADNGGVVGICQIRPFITHARKGAFDHYLNHIMHAINVAGVEHVGIGSDRDHRVIEFSEEYVAELKAEEGANFNEEEWPLFMDKLNGPRRMEVVWDGLKKKGLTDDQLEKVMGLNVFRIYEEVIG